MPKPPREKQKFTIVESIENMARCGCSRNTIAIILDFDNDKLSNNIEYRKAYEKGQENFKHDLLVAQREVAIIKKNPTMLIWLGKQYLGQCEKTQNTQIIDNAGLTLNIITSDQSDEERLKRIEKEINGN
jgi:hypothetical protein